LFRSHHLAENPAAKIVRCRELRMAFARARRSRGPNRFFLFAHPQSEICEIVHDDVVAEAGWTRDT